MMGEAILALNHKKLFAFMLSSYRPALIWNTVWTI